MQGDKWIESPEDPKLQLIAEAIAAYYQRNNFTRDRVLRIPALDEIIFSGITLVGAFPIFYKIKVTAELSDAIMGGIFPTKAVVYRRASTSPRWRNETIGGPVYNSPVYQAFKTFV